MVDERSRLQKIIPLLSSDQPGEVFSAVQQISAILKAQGRDWNDIARSIGNYTAPRGAAHVIWRRTSSGNLFADMAGVKCTIFKKGATDHETFRVKYEWRTVTNTGSTDQPIWEGPFTSEQKAKDHLEETYG